MSLLDIIKQSFARDLGGWDRTRKLVAAKIIKDLSNLNTWEEMNQYAIATGREAARNGQWTKAAMTGSLIKILDANQDQAMKEAKGTCCGKCGHVHAKGTSCPKPFLTGKSHCSRRTNEMHTMSDDGPDEFHQVRADVEEEKKGLWANIRAKRARGEKPSPKGSEAYKKAVAAGKKINAMDEADEVNEYCPMCLAEYIMENYNKLNEAEYRGRKVSLGRPFLTPGGPKKRSVYVKNAKGNVVKVNFGDPNMRIKKSNPKRRKSFRARHNCSNPGPRWKARYWSCRAW